MPYVCWIGQQEPAEANPDAVKALIKAGKLTREEYFAYLASHPIQRAIPGRTARELGIHEGLSKFYRWGPEPDAFTQLVTDADWRRIQGLAEAKQFVLVTGQAVDLKGLTTP